jgi:hypothetical protein
MSIGSDANKRSVLSTSTTTLGSSNKKTTTTAIFFSSSEFSLLISLPTPLRVYIFNYLGQTQEELMNLTLVSKQVCEDCKRPGIEWKIIPTIGIRPHQEGYDSIRARLLMQNLTHHLLNNVTRNKLQCYRHTIVNNIHRFYVNKNSTQYYDEVQEIARGIQMDDISSLDISSSLPYNDYHNSFPRTFSKMFPSLREIDLSSTILRNGALLSFSLNCPLLQKVSWNDNINYASTIYMSGADMRTSRNLKDVYMNDSDFLCPSKQEREEMSRF